MITDGTDVVGMPLSEDEQRILQEIEAHFHASDPALAQQVSETTVYRHTARNIKWATLGFIAGFVLLLVSFASNIALGFVGFMAMMGCSFVIVGNARKMGRAGLESLTTTLKGPRLKGMLGDASRNLRRPFKRGE